MSRYILYVKHNHISWLSAFWFSRLFYNARGASLFERQEIVHPSGTIYSWGTFPGKQGTWRVAVAEIGMGGVPAALEVEKALTFFSAHIALFVGIAGGLKDVKRGDVVAATKTYACESGKAAQRFEPRPEPGHSSHALEQRAWAEAYHDEWLTRLKGSRPDPTPRVFIGALAAGRKFSHLPNPASLACSKVSQNQLLQSQRVS